MELLLTGAVLAFSVLIATLVEGAVEILIGKALAIILRDQPADDIRRDWAAYGLQVISILLGVGLVFTMSLDIVGYAADLFGFEILPTVSKVMTGFIVGRGASYVHGIFSLIVAEKQKAS